MLSRSILIIAHALARGVDPISNSTTVRAGHIERGVAALIQQEAVGIAFIGVIAHDLPRVVNPGGIGRGVGRAGHVERGESVTRLRHCLCGYADEQTHDHQTAEITFHSRTLSLEVRII